ncbi:hypothetical protein DB88DRAFT_488810 [Papiliotrema laurentii]|uniref:Uncharacterized protein n=1 Tax=Papiliotrema laurentii TaxID=5418 RepID=A0AAD9D0N9_PAPLA|nr:hypothetical protein DB88DRAFT_488810 [Papiliotrema laurentii]
MTMSFLHPGAFPIPQQRSPSRTSTLPNPVAVRHTSPPPASAPALPNGTASIQLRNRPPRSSSKLINSAPEVSPKASALQAEIERLASVCEEHERKIRASRNSIEHRLFSELPHALARLNEMDDSAESMTAQLHATISSVSPALDEKLSALLSAREQDVETMRQRTTPWKTFFEDSTDDDKDSSVGRIERVKGAGLGDVDGLAQIERWAEEVEMCLTAEIVGLKRELEKKSARSGRIRISESDTSSNPMSLSAALCILLAIILAMWMGWFSLR